MWRGDQGVLFGRLSASQGNREGMRWERRTRGAWEGGQVKLRAHWNIVSYQCVLFTSHGQLPDCSFQVGGEVGFTI